MLRRWLERRRWRRSPAFGEAVALCIDDVRHFHGPKALEAARRKLRRPRQPTRRKWVWQAVVAHLEDEMRSQEA